MAHKEQIDYVNKVKSKFPEFFENKKVLGIGTFNVCGTEDQFFNNCELLYLYNICLSLLYLAF